MLRDYRSPPCFSFAPVSVVRAALWRWGTPRSLLRGGPPRPSAVRAGILANVFFRSASAWGCLVGAAVGSARPAVSRGGTLRSLSSQQGGAGLLCCAGL